MNHSQMPNLESSDSNYDESDDISKLANDLENNNEMKAKEREAKLKSEIDQLNRRGN